MNRFWRWYERNYVWNLSVATGLFLLQIVHLVWLFGEVIFLKLFGFALFTFDGLPKFLMIFVDYTEIPAIISVSLVYLSDLRKKINARSIFYLILLNLQWLHLFWITDEFVLNVVFGTESKTILPSHLAWLAIVIDYLELPIIYDTVRKFTTVFKNRSLKLYNSLR